MGNALSKNAGARMTLHDPEQEPLPDEDGIDLSPSSSSSISTTLVVHHTLLFSLWVFF